MDEARQILQSHNRYEVTLPSGIVATLRLPNITDCIIAGGVPLPVVEKVIEEVQRGEQNGKVASVEDAAAMRRYQNELVKRSVVKIDGHPITLTDDDLNDLLPDDYALVVQVAAREVEVPKVDSQA